ncbi:hypothetical protein [Marinomonas spartinae]|nr:hypothetical protein [Marinomonas spartinae]
MNNKAISKTCLYNKPMTTSRHETLLPRDLRSQAAHRVGSV